MSRAPALLVLLVLVLAAALPAAAAGQAAPEPQTSLPDIEDEVMCTICGTALQLADAPQAERERAFIQGLIDQGLTKDQIKDELVEEYGPAVLAVPRAEGFDLAAWIVPIGGFLIAIVAIAMAARRWRRSGPDDSDQTPQRDIAPEDDERLEADIARYQV